MRTSAGPATRSATSASARKYAFLSEGEGDPFSLAARVFVNLPTGDADEGAGQGGVAADVCGVLSKWLNRNVVLTGELGYNFRKNPEDPVVVHVPNFLRWGAGIGITPNDHWLIHGELLGRTWQRDTTSLDGTHRRRGRHASARSSP